MIPRHQLVDRVRSYDPHADEETLSRAYSYSVDAHGAQQRASGDPYYSHPVEVADILSEKKLDTASIVTGLLHDTVEDTLTTLEDIEERFGGEIARLVDGVTKLSRLDLQSDQTRQAENFRKLVLATSQDIRVLVVKLADRLHNMRTLQHIRNADKRRAIARETLDIYAPLAERIGIREWKDELEDLAFVELNPDARTSIETRLQFLRERGYDLVGLIVEELRQVLARHGLEAEVAGREKLPYSIWRKMQRRNIGFEQLADIMAFRLIVPDEDACYRALGIIHRDYQIVPGRFKDYISTPKPNDYRSIHTSVIGPANHRIEIQIRTREMQDIAELGVAAHWAYKQGEKLHDGRQYRWLRELLEILEHSGEPEEFLEHTKLEMFDDQAFCFSPKGDLYVLPAGSTPVDFAYAVHTDIGDTCVGAKVNGEPAPLRARLSNGDQVEIVTSDVQMPDPVWESFVATGKARACIRRFIRSREAEQYRKLGREIVSKAFSSEGYELTQKAIEGALSKLGSVSEDDLYEAVGEGRTTSRDILEAVYPGSQRREKRSGFLSRMWRSSPSKENHAIPIKGLIPGMAVHISTCCHPLPGDRIVGIVTTGRGVAVHTIDCETLEGFQETPERWLDVAWDIEGSDEGTMQIGRLLVTLVNEPGSLATLATAVSRDGSNISNLRIISRTADFFDMLVDIEVSDLRQLTDITAALRASSAVSKIERQRG